MRQSESVDIAHALLKQAQAAAANDSVNVYYYYKKAAKEAGNNPKYFHALGQMEKKIGFDKEATESFKKAYEINPFERDYIFSYAESLIRKKHLEEAEKVLMHALRIYPRDRYLHTRCALFYYVLGMHDEALSWFERAYDEYCHSIIFLMDYQKCLHDVGDMLAFKKVGQKIEAMRAELRAG